MIEKQDIRTMATTYVKRQRCQMFVQTHTHACSIATLLLAVMHNEAPLGKKGVPHCARQGVKLSV